MLFKNINDIKYYFNSIIKYLKFNLDKKMYFPSLNEFSNLNYEQKIQIVEKIQNIVEFQKKKYLKQNNDEILISSYYPKNSDINNIQNTENDLSSSTSSNDDINIKKENYIIEQARNNIINAKKDFEKFKTQYYLFKLNQEKKRENLKESISNKEINYVIESTTNSLNSSYNNNYYNYQNNSKYDVNDISFSKNKKYQINNNYNKTAYTFKKKIIKEKTKENWNKSDKIKLVKNRLNENNNNTNNNRINSPIKIKRKIQSTKSINNFHESIGKKNNTKSTSNFYKINEFNKISNIIHIKKKLNFNGINSNNNRSNRKLIRTLSSTHRKKGEENDISNRLYNMDKIIKEKINLKKKELEEEEMKNCSFVPKINNKSRKIVKKLEMKNEIKKEKFKKINVYNFFHNK